METKKRILTGITATGNLTLGNYLGVIKNFVKIQNEGKHEMFMFVADYHALTNPKLSPKELKENIINNIKMYMACGIDAKKTKFFIQSQIHGHADLFYLILTNLYEGELNRMTQYKDKKSNFTKKELLVGVPYGLKLYPALMAADIILYDIDYVPIGKDQKQHLELTQKIVSRLNSKYGLDLKVPEKLYAEKGQKIMSLKNPTKKMSKSSSDKNETIFLSDSKEEIFKKISTSLTDSENKVYYEIEKKPGISNLITIYAAINNLSIKEVEKLFSTSNYGEFKLEVSNSIISELSSIQNALLKINIDDIKKFLD